MATNAEIHRNKRPDKIYISRGILTGDARDQPQRLFRIASKVIDALDQHRFVRGSWRTPYPGDQGWTSGGSGQILRR